ncbi:hypothetical protein K6V78_05020 [Streptococcus gallolyticus]|nr:hypothetical protein [Streptococcus gallolyticus]MBY5040995.1 hypothetical protein [Streptococcus gallolyticus]
MFFSLGMLVALVLGFTVAYRRAQKELKYDERQEMYRNRGYKCATFAMLFTNVAIMLLADFVAEQLSLRGVAMLTIMVGAVVYASYAILHDAYFGFQQKGSSYILLLSVVMVLNAGLGISRLLDGTFSEESGGLNLLIAIGFASILAVIFYKKIAEKGGEE